MSNTSGWKACGHRILVLPKVMEEVSVGGIIIPQDHVHKEQMAQITALVVDVGPGCWLDTTVDTWCEVGDTVMIGKYSGLLYEGDDGKQYRAINDTDVVLKRMN